MKVNELDSRGEIALDIALRNGFESIARTLVKHKADVNLTDSKDVALLLKAILRGLSTLIFTKSCLVGRLQLSS